MNKTLLLIIDPQNDFCLPNGALYVPGAENDMARLAEFISKNRSKINQIIVSCDTHHVIDISHPYFWILNEHPYYQNNDIHPKPYTQITYKDVVNSGAWLPRFEEEKTLNYLKQLEEQGEFPHVIWPEHCIAGSVGAAITDVLMDELKNWERKTGTHFQVIEKGLNPMTEMFGVFRANIPDSNDKSTQENKELIAQISAFDKIIVAGEAKSHCVANSIKQLFAYTDIMKKMLILEDCMSDVTGFETIALPVYKEALQLGAQFVKSTKLSL